MDGMFKFLGFLALIVGYLVTRSARDGEGIFAAAFFLLGLAFLAAGVYLLFFEDGQGAARWLPFLRP